MLVRIGLLKKKGDWDTNRFRHHWLDRHGPLARQLPGLSGYVQNHVVQHPHSGAGLARGTEEFDGFSQLWFEDDSAAHIAISTELGRSLVADEGHFIGDLRIALAEQNPVVTPAKDTRLVKFMSLLKRRSDVTADRFKNEWANAQASLIKKIRNVRGYRQNLIVERQVPKGTPVAYDRFPIDGIAELWFDNIDALEAGFASSEGQLAVTHARELIAEVTVFLVDSHVIV
jgi:uncharacterized protein (TIGR02118 family)